MAHMNFVMHVDTHFHSDILKSEKYKKGISCPNCFGKISESKKQSLKDRNKQITLAKKKGLYSPLY